MLALTLLLIISASFLNLYEARKKSAELLGSNWEAKIIGEKLATAIDTVYVNGAKFSLGIELPESIGGHQYKVYLDNLKGQLIIESNDGEIVTTTVVCKNIKNFLLDRENLKNKIEIFWEESQICVGAR
ncbi:MAG: hypothetical protein APZ16_01990 [Candidatus Hadarchaeum yellowstonense]|uniref:Uncharacterized protein n=1 Tax=Hadarchaeum yellowstonense TaxID=1776334 RepID=A0A147K190_HADYE|nr:MAG: hypothetical protein APZ16_01990 [Candidatus Hadarchaeum yellowstonense]